MRKPKQTHGLTNLGTEPRKRGRMPHADDFAVDGFAAEMKAKLARKRDEGRGGWENKDAIYYHHQFYITDEGRSALSSSHSTSREGESR